ncbi:hypothetical protein Tco_0483625 [Tanacetum coccineum]
MAVAMETNGVAQTKIPDKISTTNINFALHISIRVRLFMVITDKYVLKKQSGKKRKRSSKSPQRRQFLQELQFSKVKVTISQERRFDKNTHSKPDDMDASSPRKEDELRIGSTSTSAKEHVAEIQRTKFSIGREPNLLTGDLHQTVNNISVELYAKYLTIIALGTIYKTDGKQMLHNKELPKDCYKVSVDKSLVDAACIPDVGNNGFKTVKDAVGGFFAWPKNQVVLDPKATPPSTIQMIGENKTAPKLQSKRKNIYVSRDTMQ